MQSLFIPHLEEEQKNLVVTSPTGSGKAQPLDSIIQTPGGPVVMKDITVGHEIYAYDGTTTKVKNIFPQGIKMTYRVTFGDGRSVRCCREHLWKIYDKRGHSSVKCLDEIIQHPENGPYKIPAFIPPSTGKRKVSGDAYLLGVGLGESQHPSASIPSDYFGTNLQQKTELIDGILDGMEDLSGGVANMCIFNVQRLAYDFQKLIWSIGGYCKIRQHDDRYCCNFEFDGVCRIKIKSIEEDKQEFCQCIEIEHDSKLYVTDNWIVTHNTVVAELCVAQALKSGRKGIYIAPMKALAEEKLADWGEPTHAFSQKKICVITGDHEFTTQKINDLNAADIILCTSEMLDSKTRSWQQNEWLHGIGALVGDESHIIGTKGRGPCFETAIMRFCTHNRHCRIVLMSATVPNDSDYVSWLTNLTGRETAIIKSNYRPCQLHMHAVPFDDGYKKYADKESSRANVVSSLVSEHVTRGNSVLVFIGNKRFGYNLTRGLKASGLNAEFHNADLALDKRRELETTFNAGGYDVLVASSTLAWGVNVNARVVILAHTSYGRTEMDVADILQAAGRAGRVKYHTEGDCYIVLPRSTANQEMQRINGGFTVQSQLVTLDNLIFHVVTEIHSERVTNKSELESWYRTSFASSQGYQWNDDNAKEVLEYLEKIQMIKKADALPSMDAPVQDTYKVTQLGVISSSMYMKPNNVFGWYKNFSAIGEPVSLRGENLNLCWALADIKEHQEGFLSVADKECHIIQQYAAKTGRMTPVTKIAAIYWAMLHDHPIDESLNAVALALRNDMSRIFTTLYLIHSRYAKHVQPNAAYPGWGRWSEDVWGHLSLMFQHGVGPEMIPLVGINGIGKTYATRLFNAGIRNSSDIKANNALFLSIMPGKRGQSVIDSLR